MGYLGLKNVGCSDTASDLAYACEAAYLKELSKGLKEVENSFNTSGWINVALIIESGVMDNFSIYSSAFEKFDWKFLVDKLKEEVKNSSDTKKNIEQWGGRDNMLFHNSAYRRMLKNVRKFLKKRVSG